MFRLPFYIFGVSTFITAWAFYKNHLRTEAERRVPVKKAASLLQKAWSDNHTRV
jgi:hypothetical protein